MFSSQLSRSRLYGSKIFGGSGLVRHARFGLCQSAPKNPDTGEKAKDSSGSSSSSSSTSSGKQNSKKPSQNDNDKSFLKKVRIFGRPLIETDEDREQRIQAKKERTAKLHEELNSPYFKDQQAILKGSKSKIAGFSKVAPDPIKALSSSQETLTEAGKSQMFPHIKCQSIISGRDEDVTFPSAFGNAPCVVTMSFREFAAVDKAMWLNETHRLSHEHGITLPIFEITVNEFRLISWTPNVLRRSLERRAASESLEDVIAKVNNADNNNGNNSKSNNNSNVGNANDGDSGNDSKPKSKSSSDSSSSDDTSKIDASSPPSNESGKKDESLPSNSNASMSSSSSSSSSSSRADRWFIHHAVGRGVSEDLRKALGVDNGLVGHVFLVDSFGRLRWHGQGRPSEVDTARFADAIVKLDKENNKRKK